MHASETTDGTAYLLTELDSAALRHNEPSVPTAPVTSVTTARTPDGAPRTSEFRSRRERRAFEEARGGESRRNGVRYEFMDHGAADVLQDAATAGPAAAESGAATTAESAATGSAATMTTESAAESPAAATTAESAAAESPAAARPTATPQAEHRPTTPRPPHRASRRRTRTSFVAPTVQDHQPRWVRTVAKAALMVVTAGIVATAAVPAYARTDTPGIVEGKPAGHVQSLAIGAVQEDAVATDRFSAHTAPKALTSTTGTAVAPEVQAVAQQLMAAAAQGRLVGSTPDHLFEISYLAQGRAVPNCGVDYRVLQAISFALTKFGTVGVSDINRKCTGQVEGAGTASPHYTDGGGHAVDFFLIDGHPLSGRDAYSSQLIEAMDAVTPAGAIVGQQNCGASLPLANFAQIDDTCNHVHMDFSRASASALSI
jgi:hypothetical protein